MVLSLLTTIFFRFIKFDTWKQNAALKRGAQTPGNLSPWRLIYCQKRLTLLDQRYENCFMSHFGAWNFEGFPRIINFWHFMVIMTSKSVWTSIGSVCCRRHEKRISTLSGQIVCLSNVKEYFIMLKKWITRLQYTNLMFTQILLSHCHYRSLLKVGRLYSLTVRVIRWYILKTGAILFRLSQFFIES